MHGTCCCVMWRSGGRACGRVTDEVCGAGAVACCTRPPRAPSRAALRWMWLLTHRGRPHALVRPLCIVHRSGRQARRQGSDAVRNRVPAGGGQHRTACRGAYAAAVGTGAVRWPLWLGRSLLSHLPPSPSLPSRVSPASQSSAAPMFKHATFPIENRRDFGESQSSGGCCLAAKPPGSRMC